MVTYGNVIRLAYESVVLFLLIGKRQRVLKKYVIARSNYETQEILSLEKAISFLN